MSKRARERKLTDGQLMELANEVKAQECIWDDSNINYKKTDANESAWIYISAVTGLTVEDCKRGWKSLRDKVRYRQMAGKSTGPGQSGDSDDESDLTWSEDNSKRSLDSWKFGDCLSFLSNKTLTRRRILTTDPLDVKVPIFSALSDAGSQSNSYTESEASSSPSRPLRASARVTSNQNYDNKKPKLGEVGEKLVSSVTEMVNVQKDQMGIPKLKHHAMLANLDQMMSKLPEEVVDDLNFEFVKITHEKLKEHRNNAQMFISQSN